MSRKVNTTLINQRNAERERTVQEGKFMEALDSEGRTPEGLKSAAKAVLGIGEEDYIQLEFAGKLAHQNNQTMAFIALANFSAKAENTGLISAEELNTIKEIERRVGTLMVERFGLEDLEDLYEEGE